MKLGWALLFFLMPLLAIGYVSWHLWQMLPLQHTVAKVLVSMLPLVLTVISVSRFVVGYDHMPLSRAAIMYEFCTSWLIVLLYIVLSLVAIDLLRLCRLVPADIFVGNGRLLAFLTLAIGALLVYGNIHYHYKYREALTLPADGKVGKERKIVLLSDLHLGFHNRAAEFKKWVELINREKADAVLIAGDIIDISVKPLLEENTAELFRCIEAPVYACLGNHEYFSGNKKAMDFFRDAHIQLLRDTMAVLFDQVAVVGRDDRSNRHRRSLEEILNGSGVDQASARPYTILLDHQPYQLEEADSMGIDFQFSGHTHHGQVWPLSWITDAIYEDAFGLHRRDHTTYYVTSGIGIWGGKFRIGTRSEYLVLTLKP